MANGVITASELLAVQAKMALMMADKSSPVNRLYANKKWAFVESLMNEQVVMPGKIQESGKDYSVDITWPELTGLSAVTGKNDCDLGDGEKLGTYKQTYKITDADKLNAPVVVDEADLVSNIYSKEELIAQALLQIDAAMLDRLQAKALAFVDANISNAAANGNGYTTDATGITVPAASYTEDLMADIQIAAAMNYLGSYFLITGPEFMRKAILADAKQGNYDGKGAFELLTGEKFYFDPFNLAAVANKPIYQISNNVFCWAKKNEHTSAIQEITADKFKYTVNSALMPGLSYDIIEERSCSDGNKTSYKFTGQLRNQLFLHPQSVNAPNNKGIIKWFKGA